MDQETLDPQTVQECTQEVVECIRQFVEVLRAAFPVVERSSSRLVEPRHLPDPVPLFTRMMEEGVCDQLRIALHRLQEDLAIAPPSFLSLSIESSSLDNEYQRMSLLQQVILPMLWSLSSCYRFLDSTLTRQQHSAPSASISNSQSDRPGETTKKIRAKPEPPPGLLSLQQYTDIACVLEFMVCTSILPHLDPDILLPLEDRIRYHLPKSMAGRIPRASLAWGATQPHNNELLLETATTLANLVLLDRFRPMLLPRHLADIYAALLQHEHNNSTAESQSTLHLTQIYRIFGLQSLSTPTPDQVTILDDVLQAKAFQTLLLQGIKTPAWLRQRVAPFLTKLACTNLSAIVQVFVPLQQTHGEVSSMASNRLGRTLASSSATNLLHTQHLAQQIRFLLETLYVTVRALDTAKVPPQASAILQTIWAILHHWPTEVLHKHLIEVWHHSLSSTNDQDNYKVHITVRQIGCLCAYVPPPATGPWRILRHFFHRPVGGDTPCPSIMAMLLRLASMPKTLIHSQVDQEARQALYCLYQATAASQEVEVISPLKSGLAFVVTACVDGIAANSWDLEGYSYKVILSKDERAEPAVGKTNQSEDSHLSNLEGIHIEQQVFTEATNPQVLIDSITTRATVILETCLSERTTENATSPLTGFASMIFRLLLRIYLSGSRSMSHSTPAIHCSHQLAAIIFLPLLCEKCSPETLLFGPGSDTDALGLLQSIKLLLTCAVQRLVSPQENDARLLHSASGKLGDEALETNSDDDNDSKMVRYLSLLLPTEEVAVLPNASIQSNNWINLIKSNEHAENSLSIISIVLSLLIALLELGNRSRSSGEEDILQGCLPVLSLFAEFGNQSNSSLLTTQLTEAGISDMAAYAMSLIASRRAQPLPTLQPIPIEAEDKVRATIDQARQDLESNQPPIRARGMVLLGRLARGYLGVLSPNDSKSKLVVDWDATTASDDKLINDTVRDVLELSLMALSDQESYVYLSAVQTIVAIGDLRPKQVMPKLAAALVNGQLEVGSSLAMSNQQRVKLAEALMFIIRRRAAPAEYLSQMLSIIIFGSTKKIGATMHTTSDENKRLFALETDKYFVGIESQEVETGFLEARVERWKEQDIRIKTGGPVYTLEEDDLVRATRLSVLAELVSVTPPTLLARYCRLLMRLATDVLRQDGSRTACRAAALLARQFYDCLNRESEESGSGEDSPFPLAVAVVGQADEEQLLATTLGDFASARGKYSHDPATSARCQEALQLREEAGDLLVAARLLEAQCKTLSRYPTVLRSIVESRPPIGEINALKTLE